VRQVEEKSVERCLRLTDALLYLGAVEQAEVMLPGGLRVGLAHDLSYLVQRQPTGRVEADSRRAKGRPIQRWTTMAKPSEEELESITRELARSAGIESFESGGPDGEPNA
jgi:hypothetical protein